MILRILLTFCLLLAASGLRADEIALNPEHPETYVVVRGDTLWDIAGRFLQKPWQWPQIWRENPQIRNPHWIYPGDELRLTYVDGKPQLTVGRPSELRLSPQVRISPLEQAIPVIPMNAVRQFLTRPKVVGAGELESAPYVVDFAEEHIVGGAGDRIYARGLAEQAHDDGFMIFRPGAAYRDPDTREVLGYEALSVGDATLERGGEIATLQLTRTEREVIIGDRLLPVEQETMQMQYQPHAPDKLVEGHIISVVDGVSQIGQYQVIIIDRGYADGLETGHVLDIYRAGRTERDIVSRQAAETVDLPREKSGTLLVFKPYERVSFGLVMKATRALHINDAVVTP
ncbi:LysM peptidoglycan-binding domain-containing protein [Methylococcus sp. EFPC2]|uniref:LysM peptidoglycan-binding domain-containing protein n=1 Tax=Methylococcus sp. EFPC2 TaxID=2812648 RepID=UPI0019681F4C|nr:LysM domain-containing protein [Methylococcus sp. EFPC2]QSA96806.1 LysM peptidoglycan-binding domain-containing protein [Methylococcus sp. EFPC2]